MFIQHINSAHQTLTEKHNHGESILLQQYFLVFSINNSVAVIQSPGGSVTSAYIYTQLRATVNPAKELNTVKDRVAITNV